MMQCLKNNRVIDHTLLDGLYSFGVGGSGVGYVMVVVVGGLVDG